MRDQVLIISLNVQNLIVSNVENVPSCYSFSGWIVGQDYAMKIFIDTPYKISDTYRPYHTMLTWKS
jgi:hypothetical protein